MILLNKLMILISILLLLLCILMPLKRSAAAKERPFLRSILRPHTIYGVLLLITSLIHGILAGSGPAMISGKIAWLCLLILLVLSFFRGRMQATVWKKLHRRLSILLCALVLIHIVHAIVI